MEARSFDLEMRAAMYEQYHALSSKTKPTSKQELFHQRLILMTYRDDFQQEVRYLRKCFGIPEEGFSDFAASRKWAREIIADPREYARKDPLRAYAKLKERKAVSPAGEYGDAFKALLRSFGIHARWDGAVEYYVWFNKVDAHEILPKTVEVHFAPDKMTGENTLYLRISGDTELRDVQEWWSTIESFQGLMRSQRGLDLRNLTEETMLELLRRDPTLDVEKQKSKKERRLLPYSLDKIRRAYQLRAKGETYNEIAKKIRCSQGQVGTYIKRFRDAIQAAKLD